MICVCLEHVFAQRIREIGIRILRMAAVGRERFTRVAGSRERVRGIQDKRFNGKLNGNGSMNGSMNGRSGS